LEDLREHLKQLENEESNVAVKLQEALANAHSRTTVRTPGARRVEVKRGKQVPVNKAKKVDTDPVLQRRCLALISHNNMKPAMQEFVMKNKEVLRHFRLTGTNSTMTMLQQVFQGMKVEYGPTMSSGPLGGDAQVAALLTQGDLGGMIFFADPLSAHPHIADVHSLIRLANVHNILYACNPTTAVGMIMCLKAGLKDPSIIPSFYETLESPSVAKYRAEQKALVEMLKERQMQLMFARQETQTLIASETSRQRTMRENVFRMQNSDSVTATSDTPNDVDAALPTSLSPQDIGSSDKKVTEDFTQLLPTNSKSNRSTQSNI